MPPHRDEYEGQLADPDRSADRYRRDGSRGRHGPRRRSSHASDVSSALGMGSFGEISEDDSAYMDASDHSRDHSRDRDRDRDRDVKREQQQKQQKQNRTTRDRESENCMGKEKGRERSFDKRKHVQDEQHKQQPHDLQSRQRSDRDRKKNNKSYGDSKKSDRRNRRRGDKRRSSRNSLSEYSSSPGENRRSRSPRNSGRRREHREDGRKNDQHQQQQNDDELAMLRKQLSDALSVKSKLEERLTKQDRALRSLKRDNEHLARSLDEAKAARSQGKAIRELCEENERLTSENRQLRDRMRLQRDTTGKERADRDRERKDWDGKAPASSRRHQQQCQGMTSPPQLPSSSSAHQSSSRNLQPHRRSSTSMAGVREVPLSMLQAPPSPSVAANDFSRGGIHPNSSGGTKVNRRSSMDVASTVNIASSGYASQQMAPSLPPTISAASQPRREGRPEERAADCEEAFEGGDPILGRTLGVPAIAAVPNHLPQSDASIELAEHMAQQHIAQKRPVGSLKKMLSVSGRSGSRRVSMF